MDKRDYTNKSQEKQENTATYQKKARNKGTHLKIYEITKIEYMLKKGAKIREIAEEIGVSERTIYREKKRGMVKGLLNSDLTTRDEYDYQCAQSKYETAQKNKQRDLKIGKNIELTMYLEKSNNKREILTLCSIRESKKRRTKPKYMPKDTI